MDVKYLEEQGDSVHIIASFTYSSIEAASEASRHLRRLLPESGLVSDSNYSACVTTSVCFVSLNIKARIVNQESYDRFVEQLYSL